MEMTTASLGYAVDRRSWYACAMANSILVYGAYGYTAQLIARFARERGVELVLAGRDPERTRAVAEATGHAHTSFGLAEPRALAEALAGHSVVIHCAGPFEHTYRAMADACLASGVHYVDITGEISVFEGLAARDAESRSRGVMLLPGGGFDVVPSDCLAAHLHRRLPTATHLELAFRNLGGAVSHGTAMTMVENLHRGGLVRRDGVLVEVPTAHATRTIEFPTGAQPSMTIPWGDVSTAYHSTGIPNILVYTGVPRGAATLARISQPFASWLGSSFTQRTLKRMVDGRPAGPDDAMRARAKSELWGEARDGSGNVVRATLVTPEGYTLTALTALDIAVRAARGEAKPGFMTPSKAFGADYVLGFDGVVRADF